MPETVFCYHPLCFDPQAVTFEDWVKGTFVFCFLISCLMGYVTIIQSKLFSYCRNQTSLSRSFYIKLIKDNWDVMKIILTQKRRWLGGEYGMTVAKKETKLKGHMFYPPFRVF